MFSLSCCKYVENNSGFSGNSVMWVGTVMSTLGYTTKIVNNKPALDNSWMKKIIQHFTTNQAA